MEVYYTAKKSVTKLINKIPPIPTSISGIPLVAYGFVGLTIITLAAVTIYETNGENPLGETDTETSSSSPLSIPTPEPSSISIPFSNPGASPGNVNGDEVSPETKGGKKLRSRRHKSKGKKKQNKTHRKKG
jgi:hypothetical protein